MMLLFALLACTGTPADTGTDECADAPNVTWVSFGDGFFSTYCRACHSVDTQNRFDAPADVNFDTLDEVRSYKASIKQAVIVDGSMPVGGGVYDDDITLLGYFLDCGI